MRYSKKTFQEFGRQGGVKGGPARNAALTPERRREIAKKGAEAKWAKYRLAKAT